MLVLECCVIVGATEVVHAPTSHQKNAYCDLLAAPAGILKAKSGLQHEFLGRDIM